MYKMRTCKSKPNIEQHQHGATRGHSMARNALCPLLLAAAAALAEPVPTLELNVDIHQWTATYPETNDFTRAATALGISNVALKAYADGSNLFAIACIETTLADAQATWLEQTNDVQLAPLANGDFGWDPKSTKKSMIPTIDSSSLNIRFSGNRILFAPPRYMEMALAHGQEERRSPMLSGMLDASPMATPLLALLDRFASSQTNQISLATISAMVRTARGAVASIRHYPSIAIEIDASEEGVRNMDLSLSFDSSETALVLQAFLATASRAWMNPSINDRQVKLLGLLDNAAFQSMERDGGSLHFNYRWAAADDKKMMGQVAAAIVGSLPFLPRDGEFPANGTQTIDPPVLLREAAINNEGIAEAIRGATFLDHQWDANINLAIDYLDLPNVDLAEGTISSVQLLAADGTDIAKKPRSGGFSYDNRQRRATITLNKDERNQDAATASFILDLAIPDGVQLFTLSEEQRFIDSGDGGICLVALSNSVVTLRSKGISLRDAKVYARNREGEYLASSGALWSDSSYRGEFNGLPASVVVAIPTSCQDVAVSFTNIVVGNGPLEMPQEPTSGIPARYTCAPTKSYTDPDLDEWATRSMTLSTNAGWRKDECQLQFPMEAGCAIDNVSMKSYLAGGDTFAFEGRSSGYSYSDTSINWSIPQTGPLRAAAALFGQMSATLWSGIGCYETELSTNFTPFVEGFELPAAAAEQNVVWVRTGPDGHVLEVRATDSTGRRLKPSNRQSSRNAQRGYHFWGQPAKATIVYASTNATLDIPFGIALKEGGMDAVPKARTQVESFEAFIAEIRGIEEMSRQFGDLLSASHYASSPQNEPVARIPLEVAHADPEGASVFGYEATPYKGYLFRRVPTTRTGRPDLSSHAWAGGSFDSCGYATSFLLAVPISSERPTILCQWDDVYVHYGTCPDPEAIDTSTWKMREDGWIEIW